MRAGTVPERPAAGHVALWTLVPTIAVLPRALFGCACAAGSTETIRVGILKAFPFFSITYLPMSSCDVQLTNFNLLASFRTHKRPFLTIRMRYHAGLCAHPNIRDHDSVILHHLSVNIVECGCTVSGDLDLVMPSVPGQRSAVRDAAAHPPSVSRHPFG